MTTFDDYIKAIRTEIEAIKAERRRSALTFKTKTITATATAVLYKTQVGGVIIPRYDAIVELIPADPDNRLIFGYSQPSFAYRGNRAVTLTPWIMDNGNPAVLLDPGGAPADASMANGSTKTITLSLTIVASGDFTIATHQILKDTRT